MTSRALDGPGLKPDLTDLPAAERSRLFPLVVFIATFGLLLSDYMARQVLAAVFPVLKTAWSLTDTQLGTLTGVVSLTVGLLAVPLSLLGDRWSRSKAIVAMATLWSLATLASAVAAGYGELMAARFFVGVGEAAYGSVGLAVVLMVYSPTKRATLTGAFMAGGSFGSVLGVFLGGILAVHLGWRWAFAAMAALGLMFVLLYVLFVSDAKLARHEHPGNACTDRDASDTRAPLRLLVSTPSVVCAYIGSGLQLFVVGTLFAWTPSWFNRVYGLAPDRAGVASAAFILVMGLGMIVCGMVTDRISVGNPNSKWTSSLAYAVLSLLFLSAGFSLHAGAAQIGVVLLGAFFAAGITGPAGAMVANLTPPSIRATAFGTLTLANNLLGLAAGPVVAGMIADRLGLAAAMRIVPLVSVPAILALVIGLRAYPASIRRAQRVSQW